MNREDEVTSPPADPGGREHALQPGRLLGGRYQITGYIGAGGMGAVYSAKHARTGRDLAVKVLLPALATRADLMQRFMSEARAAGGLNHPGIVEVVDLDHDGDLHYIVMERLEGEELQARMRREHPLEAGFAARIGADIADAIACAHSHSPKIIHRDLKPQNIFLARKGPQRDVVKILDFGIAKLVEAETLEKSLTRSGEIYGTPLYMSPEQLRNPKDVDERADIYAIGVILFHALADAPPFKGESFPDLVIAISTQKHPPLRSLRPDVPAGLAAVVEKAMARNKQDRHASAGHLRDALLQFASPRADDSDMVATTRALPATVTMPQALQARHRSRRVFLGVVAAGIATVAVALGLRQRRRRDATAVVVRPPELAPHETPTARRPALAAPDAAAPAVAPEAAVVPVRPAGVPGRPAEKATGRGNSRRRGKPARESSDLPSDLPPLRPR